MHEVINPCFIAYLQRVYDMAHATPENFYHGLLLGATVFTQPHDYQVLSNREAGYGRFDIAIYPKQHTEHYAVIIECKALTT